MKRYHNARKFYKDMKLAHPWSVECHGKSVDVCKVVYGYNTHPDWTSKIKPTPLTAAEVKRFMGDWEASK